MTNFDKNTLKFDKINNPSPPDRSDQTKVYFDGSELKKLDYNGQVSPLVPEVNLVSAEADVTPDGFEYKISIPNPNKLIEQLKATVSGIENNVNNLDSELNKKITDEIVTINSLISNLDATTEAALSSFEESVSSSIENILSIIATDEELIKDKEDKQKAEERYTLIKSEIGELSTLINVQRELVDALRVEVNNKLEAKATSVDLQGGLSSIRKEIPVIRSGSNNVTVNKSGSVYTISVSVPEVTQRVVERVTSSASGITKSRVESLIQEALEGFVGGKEITSTDGSVTIVETDTTIDLSVDISGGSGFIPLAGDGITITPVGSNWEFSVSDYISSTEVASISGDLQAQIEFLDNPGIQGKFILDSSGKVFTINHPIIDSSVSFPVVSLETPISGSDLFVVGVFDRNNESFKVELSGVPNSNYSILWHISSIQSINLSNYITSSEVELISSNLQNQIDEIPVPESSNSNIQIFTSNGTWIRPEGSWGAVEVTLIAGGQGGGAGARTTGTGSLGGSGGAGGRCVSRSIPFSLISENVSVTVGAGGAGAPGRTTNGTPVLGASGGDTTFGTFLTTSFSLYPSGNGGNPGSSTSGVAGSAGQCAGGGGSGGGVSSGPTFNNGGNGGRGNNSITSGIGNTPGGAGATTPTNGSNSQILWGGGGGGGSRSSGGSGAANNGANGGLYGGGGGGGGSGLNVNSGGGGDGAPGIAIIVTRK